MNLLTGSANTWLDWREILFPRNRNFMFGLLMGKTRLAIFLAKLTKVSILLITNTFIQEYSVLLEERNISLHSNYKTSCRDKGRETSFVDVMCGIRAQCDHAIMSSVVLTVSDYCATKPGSALHPSPEQIRQPGLLPIQIFLNAWLGRVWSQSNVT